MSFPRILMAAKACPRWTDGANISDRTRHDPQNIRLFSGAPREYINLRCLVAPSMLSANGVYALTPYNANRITDISVLEPHLTDNSSSKPVLWQALALALLIGAAASSGPARAQSAAAEG